MVYAWEDLTLTAYIEWVSNWTLSVEETVSHYMNKAKNDTYNGWIHMHDDYVSKHLASFSDRLLHAAPIGIKDNILTKWYTSTCWSKILKWYVAPYSATCFEKLETAWWLMLGKVNMDEFAMWASTEYSAYWNTLNPLDPTRVPGWSSGWSASVVAADQCLAALGTETWGSVRQPAALCGLVGVKPSYGRISRYGVQAMAASINQVWTMTKTVDDAVLLFDAISGYDTKDAKSVQRNDAKQRYEQLKRPDLTWIKCAVPNQFMDDHLDPEIKATCEQAIAGLKQLWAEVDYIDLPILQYVVPTYYIIVPAEVSTDMARFDGLRFGMQDDTNAKDHIYDYYESIRKQWFGDEVKRRIIVGSYVLSAGHYDAYYHKALHVVKKIKKEFSQVYKDYDAIIWPTTPSVAWKLWEKWDDPLQMYLEDIYTCAANLTGVPAMSVPIGTIEKEWHALPVWLQIMTDLRDEATMFGIGKQLENHIWFVRPKPIMK